VVGFCRMMCINCCSTVQELYNGQASNIRLTRCPKCEKICDKYIEYEQPLIFLDVALQRLEAYRHILFNSLVFQSSSLWLVALLAAAGRTVLSFFESFVWQNNVGHSSGAEYVVNRPLPAPAFSWLIWAFVKQLLWLLLRWAIQSQCALRVAAASSGRMRQLSFRQLVHALSMSSYGYTAYVLMMAWDYDSRIHVVVSIFVFISNAVAMHAAIECGTLWYGPDSPRIFMYAADFLRRAISITLPPMFIGWLFDSYVGLGLSVSV
jgi:hypothetical protein